MRWLAGLVIVLSGCAGRADDAPPQPPATAKPAKIYVAVEDGETITVLDGRDLRLLKNIPTPMFMPHNVQVAPDGSAVWSAIVAMEGMGAADEVVQIDPRTDEIVARIPLGEEIHPAHVVVTPDSKTVLVTGVTRNEIIRIDVATRKITDRTVLDHGSGVHGARVSRDGMAIWAAQIDGKCAARVDLMTGKQEHVMLAGQAVQMAMSLDGKYAFASQYDTRQIARIDLASRAVTYVALPADSQGPVQLYPSTDGRSILVADQGLLADRPASNKLYVVDIASSSVTATIPVGTGAHGVVSYNDTAYVTAIGDDTVTAVDLTTKKVVARATVGKKPNGISAWSDGLGTP
jgi:YVTN family beta-propeller protein